MPAPQNVNNGPRVNTRIRVPEVKVVSESGLVGVMPTHEALRLAREQGLDLVEINPKASPPICKIIDFGKFKYDEKKRQTAARKAQHVQELKEIKLRPKTDTNDLNHKIEQAQGFLNEGHRVKFTVRFRGREITHPGIAQAKLQEIASKLTNATITPCTMDGRTMIMIASPK